MVLSKSLIRIKLVGLLGGNKMSSIITDHEKEKVVRCPMCGESGKRREPIQAFLQAGYTPLDHYICNSCEKSFYI